MDEDELSRVRNQLVGFVFQFFNLIPNLTVLENVELPLYFSGSINPINRNRALELLERVGMGHRLNHRPLHLSGGEQQRVAIARALVNNPLIVLADEPTGNLDSTTTRDILSLFLDLRQQLGTTFLIVTHDPQVASIADRILYLYNGRLR